MRGQGKTKKNLWIALFSLSALFTGQLTADNWTAYVGSLYTGDAYPVNIATNAVGSAIFAGGQSGFSFGPRSIAIAPDGKTAYVVNSFTNSIIPIDVRTNSEGEPIASFGVELVFIAITPDGKTAYVVDRGGNSVWPITLANNSVGDSIAVGPSPQSIAISPDGNMAYVTNSVSNTVTPITLATSSVASPIPVGLSPQRIAITPDGKMAYVANSVGNSVTPIILATNTPLAPIAVGGIARDIAITPDGKTAYVTVGRESSKSVVIPIDVATNTFSDVIFAGSTGNGLAITPDGKTVYVLNSGPGMITLIDVATNMVSVKIPSIAPVLFPIAITPDQAPTASFTVKHAHAGASANFDASNSSSPVGSIAKYIWNFGDGSSETTTSPYISHTYGVSGAYKVKLQVVNTAGTSICRVFTGQTMSRNGGSSAKKSKKIRISAP